MNAFSESAPHGFQVRVATVADVAAMEESRRPDPDAGPADPRMAAYLEGRHHPQHSLAPRVVYIAEVDGAPAGYIAGHLTRRYGCDGEVQYLYVAPTYRRSGIGTGLLRELARWFVAQGAKRICVDVDAGSPAAAPFYQRHGGQILRPHWLLWPNVKTVIAPVC